MNTKSLIDASLQEMRRAAVADVVRVITSNIEKAAKEFMGKDLQVEAPYPKGTLGKTDYRMALNKRNFLTSIFEVKRDGIVTPKSSMIVIGINQTMVKRKIEEASKKAEEDFNAFVNKLTEKIGSGVTKVTANSKGHSWMWIDSDLHVTKSDGFTEVWSTKRILNHSKYSLPFNQWRTTLKKSK